MYELQASWSANCDDRWRMLPLALLALFAASVVLAGGNLERLGDVRFRHVTLLLGALVAQVLALAVLDGVAEWLLAVLHVGSFVAAGAFVWLNRAVPGVLLLGLGGALNLTAIVANDGVMPAREGALRAAGRPVVEEGFRNSAALADPNVPWLGDVFAIPAQLPLSNVFSVGDVVLLVGALVLLHVTCGSRLARRPVPLAPA